MSLYKGKSGGCFIRGWLGGRGGIVDGCLGMVILVGNYVVF